MSYQRIVVKLGTTVLTGGSKELNRPVMVDLARQCAAAHHEGYDIIICSSGAMAAGRERLGFAELPPTVSLKQMFSAVGQSRLMYMWENFFEIYGLHVGQLLLTRADVESRRRYLNARDALQALLEQRIIPIVNENDAVATEEIRVGDNDNLSALVATLAGADKLFLLTDIQGLYTADPKTDPQAELIKEVPLIDERLKASAGGSLSGLGVGGMSTKLEAAEIATRAGCEVIIAAGDEPNVISRLIAGESLGTRFPARTGAPESRKQWLLTGPKSAGRITVDAGAARALTKQGKSLLPAGIVAVDGSFSRSDIITICGPDKTAFARGMVRYRAEDLRQIAGCHSDEIEARLGYEYGPVAIHRNDMILL